MAMRGYGRLMIAVQHAVPPTEDEWQRWLSFASHAEHELRALVETHGPCGPDARQRQQLAATVRGIDVRTAILTDSVVTRGIVTAIAWFGVSLRAFPHGSTTEAHRYLELTTEEQARVLATLPDLRRECGLTAPTLAAHD